MISPTREKSQRVPRNPAFVSLSPSLTNADKTPPTQSSLAKQALDMMTYLLQNRIVFVSGYLNDDVSV